MHSTVQVPVVIFLVSLLFFPSSSALSVRFLDVGEGDAVLLQSADKTMLIDSGTKDSGNLTKLYLRSLNISMLDQVMITSPAEGRTGALVNIMNNTTVGAFLYGDWDSRERSYLDVLSRLQENNTPMTVVGPGSQIPFSSDVTIDLLSPGNKTWESASDTLVPKITCGNVTILLMGDDPIVSGTVAAQIIRVADHGSREGSDARFIHLVGPEVAIVSTGPNDRGNPATGTLNLFENEGASVLRTDLNGVITIITDGTDYQVEKFRMEPEMTFSLISVVETRAPSAV